MWLLYCSFFLTNSDEDLLKHSVQSADEHHLLMARSTIHYAIYKGPTISEQCGSATSPCISLITLEKFHLLMPRSTRVPPLMNYVDQELHLCISLITLEKLNLCLKPLKPTKLNYKDHFDPITLIL